MRLAIEMQMEEEAAFQQRLLAMAGAGDVAEEEEEEVEVPLDDMTYQEVSDLQDAIGYVSRAAPTTAVQALPSRTYEASAGEEEKCAVCQFAFEAGEVLTRLPCSHEFHHDCAKASLAHNKRCPMCKADVTEEQGDPKRRRS